jgi:AraC-like DNA-binding protein
VESPYRIVLARTHNYRVKHAIAVVVHNLGHVGLNVNALASSLRISPSHLRRILLSATDMTPNQLIKHCRLERTRELLTGVLSIKEISHAVGIRDVSHFVRDFKAKYSIRPSEYRRMLNANTASAVLSSTSTGDDDLGGMNSSLGVAFEREVQSTRWIKPSNSQIHDLCG